MRMQLSTHCTRRVKPRRGIMTHGEDYICLRDEFFDSRAKAFSQRGARGGSFVWE